MTHHYESETVRGLCVAPDLTHRLAVALSSHLLCPQQAPTSQHRAKSTLGSVNTPRHRMRYLSIVREMFSLRETPPGMQPAGHSGPDSALTDVESDWKRSWPSNPSDTTVTPAWPPLCHLGQSCSHRAPPPACTSAHPLISLPPQPSPGVPQKLKMPWLPPSNLTVTPSYTLNTPH